MSGEFYVQIIAYKGDKVIEELGPFPGRQADKVDDGININLNHDAFYTLVVEEDK